MSFLSKIFGSGSQGASDNPRNPDKIRARIADLEAQARRERAGYQGMPLNRAGDLCLEIDDKDTALGFYGRAIDALLRTSRPSVSTNQHWPRARSASMPASTSAVTNASPMPMPASPAPRNSSR